jgi:hypothetical protein
LLIPRDKWRIKSVGALKTLVIDTTEWNVDDYTFQIKTKPENACGLNKNSGDRKSLSITSEIDIAAQKTTCIKLETVRLTVTGMPGDSIEVKADPSSSNVIFPGRIEGNPLLGGTDMLTHVVDAEGTRTYAVRFNQTGSFTISVIGGPRDGYCDTVDITELVV